MNILDKLIKTFLTEEDFKNAPLTDEGDGVFQVLFTRNKMFVRNVDTGKISIIKT